DNVVGDLGRIAMAAPIAGYEAWHEVKIREEREAEEQKRRQGLADVDARQAAEDQLVEARRSEFSDSRFELMDTARSWHGEAAAIPAPETAGLWLAKSHLGIQAYGVGRTREEALRSYADTQVADFILIAPDDEEAKLCDF